MEEIELSGTSTNVGSYVYDYNHLRSAKTVSSTTTYYVYGLNGLLYGEYDASGNFIREYVYLNDQHLAQIDSGAPETLTYLHTDHLGTPRFGTNTSGTQVWSWGYDAFGTSVPSGSATINLRFAGQYFDDESDLHYNWHRYYDPTIGRYISSDPIGLDGGMNTYNYAEVSPLMYIDPEGLYWVQLGQGAIAAGQAALRAGLSFCAKSPGRCGLKNEQNTNKPTVELPPVLNHCPITYDGPNIVFNEKDDEYEKEWGTVWDDIKNKDEELPSSQPPEDEEEYCKRIKTECLAECSDTSLPTTDYGTTFFRCVNDCEKRKGC